MPAGSLTAYGGRTTARLPKRKPKLRRYRTVHRNRKASLFQQKAISGDTFKSDQSVQVQKGFVPFSTALLARMPWCHNTNITAPGTYLSDGSLTYRLNGARDPDYVSTGTSPQQWDQVKGLYSKYLVYACKITLEYTNPSAGGLFVGYGLRYTGDPGAYTGMSLDTLAMKRHVKMQPLSSTGSRSVKMNLFVRLHDIFGVTKDAYADNDDEYGGNVATGAPTREAWVTPIILDAAGGTAYCQLRIAITYYMRFYQPQWQAPST